MDAMRLGSKFRNWWGGSLQRRLLLSNTVTTALFLLILGLVAFWVGATNLQQQVEEGHRRLAVLLAKDINAQYGHIVESVGLLRGQLEREAHSLSGQAQAMMDLRLGAPMTYRALYLFDATGDPLVSVVGPVEELAARPIEETIASPFAQAPSGALDAYRQTGTGGMFTSPVQIIGADRTPVLYIGAAFAGEDGQVLVVEVDLRSLWQRVDEVYAGQTGRALVVSRDGVIIAHPDRAYIGEPLPPPLRPVLDGYEGGTTYTDLPSGQVMLAAYSPVGKQSGWGIVVEQEYAEALAPLRTIALATLGVLLVAAVMATLVTVIVGRGIVRPLQTLEAATQEIARTGDLGREVVVERKDEVGQLAGTFNQMIGSLRKAGARAQQLLEQQIAVNQLALALGAASDLDTICHTAYECVRGMMDCAAFIVSFYDRETDLIRAGYVVTDGAVRDVADFPPIPLEKEGRGIQSRVIRTGEPLYTPDHGQAMDATETKYKIDEEGNVTPGAPPEEEEDSTRSALYVPIKIEGRTVGVMQAQSHRLDGYDEEDRDLLSALANVTAVAVQNARLLESLRQSNQELEAQRANLEELVAQRTAELNEQIGETEQVNRALANLLEDIQVVNRGLEQTTRQLEQANEELESFSYSVSHDLRAPLRAIDGFSRILQEEYAPELGAEAQRYLGLVRDNAQQMGWLIDDLLAFSRLSRRSLDKQSVSPADLARQVLEELAHEYEGRRVEISIAELPKCQADPSLLKQVYVNLLSNALKYTRERETARIEVGTVGIKDVRSQIADFGGDQSEISDPQSAIYFVRDNGVGFDMRYADKLFGVFQRFHRAEEYEGTGVGLAIVQRIVRRHGGRVWAEAEVDKGATFYFTISDL